MGVQRQRKPQKLLRLRPLILFAALLLPLVATVRDGPIATERRADAVVGLLVASVNLDSHTRRACIADTER